MTKELLFERFLEKKERLNACTIPFLNYRPIRKSQGHVAQKTSNFFRPLSDFLFHEFVYFDSTGAQKIDDILRAPENHAY